ncbi:MAG: hypothetical protein K8T90_07895 [Planctomycetes bacterium]|nr:hypothetical protein [Planctomycetota bacterium]
MATVDLRRFANPDALKSVHPANLTSLLAPHERYLAKRRAELRAAQPPRQAAAPADEGAIDYAELAKILLTPTEETPPKLIDALYLVQEMATPEAMQQIFAAIDAMPPAIRIVLDVGPEPTPADVALCLWLKSPALLERLHAQQSVVAGRKSFESYLARRAPDGPFETPVRPQIDSMEIALGKWFASKKKGDAVQMDVQPGKGETWFTIRHGEAYRREGALKGGESTSVVYRPEKTDVVVYDHVANELRVNAGTVGEKELYRTTFGLHLFGTEDYFESRTRKYTLDPLRLDGPQSLVCADVEGIEWIQLVEVSYFLGGAQKETLVRRANDLFAAIEEGAPPLLAKVPIIAARFRVKFKDSKRPRMAKIQPKSASFGRDDDGRLLEEWLRLRTFTLARRRETDAVDGVALARA